MEKTITVNGQEVKLKTNAGIVRRYREKFKRNLTSDMLRVEEAIEDVIKDYKKTVREELKKKGIGKDDPEYEAALSGIETFYFSDLPVEVLEIFENLAYMMHKYADPEQPDDVDEWLDQFETFDIYQIFPEILGLWNMDASTTTQSKKK